MSLLTSGDKGNLADYGMGVGSNMWQKKEKDKEARKGKCEMSRLGASVFKQR